MKPSFYQENQRLIFEATRRVTLSPHYYLMKSKKILRLESNQSFKSLDLTIREKIFDAELESLDQNQANWRVAIFRDEIMDFEEYTEWLLTPESLIEEGYEIDYDMTAN
jgi:hypothetical protein